MSKQPTIKTELEEIQTSIKLIDAKVDKALSYLYDDENTKTPGLVQQVRQNTADISTLKEDKRVDKKVTVGLGVGGGGAAMAIYELIKFIAKHI